MSPTEGLTLLAIVLTVALLLWVVVAYNRLVRSRLLVAEAWSGVDVQLRRRHDLVPRLVETVSGFARFEKSVLTEVTELRSRVSNHEPATPQLQDGENALADRVGRLLLLVEDYPDLRADKSFLSLQQELIEIEEALQMARRYYNGAVRDYSIRRESFPSNLVAGAFSFEPREFFEVQSATERLAPKVDLDASAAPEADE